MKVRLIVEVTDDQRRALSGGRKLATRDDVRAYVEGALGQLGVLSSSFVDQAPSALSAPLAKKVKELKEKGWGDDAVGMYIKGWQSLDTHR